MTNPNPIQHGPSRRSVLAGGAGIAGLTLGAAKAQAAAGPGGRDLLLYVFLRGGTDALTLVPPYADPELAVWRPNTAVPPPGQADGAIDLDGFFGLHPRMAPLMDPWLAGDLAILQAAGSTDPDRSHFAQMQRIETGTPGQPGGAIGTGWLGRHLSEVSALAPSGLRGIAFEANLPRTLVGAPRVLPLIAPELLQIPGAASTASARRDTYLDLSAQGRPNFAAAMQSTMDAIDTLPTLPFTTYVPENGAQYPATPWGDSMKRAAVILKADIGMEAIQADLGGWDTHIQTPIDPMGTDLDYLMDELSQGLQAFWLDCASYRDRVTVVCMSEFGRRVDETGGDGSDHGRGGVMFVLGGNVNGGQIYGTWPGMSLADLDDKAIEVTTDYRDVLHEVLAKRIGNPVQAEVWPQFTPGPALGVVN